MQREDQNVKPDIGELAERAEDLVRERCRIFNHHPNEWVALIHEDDETVCWVRWEDVPAIMEENGSVNIARRLRECLAGWIPPNDWLHAVVFIEGRAMFMAVKISEMIKIRAVA